MNRPLLLFLHADVRKAQEVERFRFPFSTPLPLVDRKRTELQKPCLFGMQFQVELLHSFREFRPKLIGIRSAVKSNHDVVRKSHHDHIAVRALLTPRLDPQIEYVMKVDVCQKRRSTPALGRPFFHPYRFPIFQHAGIQPFLDQPHDAPVGHPMLDELDQPFVGKPIEKTFNVKIEHPVHFSCQQSRVQCIQRLMLASPWAEPVREAEKIRFVDGVQHLDRCTLDDLVFQRWHSERSLPRRDKRRRCVGGRRGVAVTGSLSDCTGAWFRASISFLRPPISSRMAGFPDPVGDSSFPLGPFHDDPPR